MKKHIWIMNHYAGEMLFNCGGRHYSFSKYLKQAGYSPVIFCANSKHGKAEPYLDTEDLWHVCVAEEIDVPFVFVKARTYIGNGRQRILNMTDFYRNVQRAAKEYAKGHGRPDIIYASSVHPLTLVAGLRLAKYFGVRCVCEIRDLWPETIVAYSSKFTKDHLLIKLLYQGEKWIYKKADSLVFTMDGAYDYILERGWNVDIPRSKVTCINNGVDLGEFHRNREAFFLEDSNLDDEAHFKVIYTGSIRRINHIGLLLDAAKQIADPRIRILIWGDGDELDVLRRRLETEHIENVVLKGRVGKQYVPSIVCQADLNLVHWEMSPILRFGVSYNKLFEYLAAGRPVFSTVRPGYSIVEKYRCGADTEGFTPESIAAGIQWLAALPPEDRAQMGRNAQEAAGEYDFRTLTERLTEILEGDSLP